ncbi:MAG TPA: hypothetical protein VMT74_03895 [Gaiellaceae bacterium]|nr:hypothetical protein [Gaiellaceae bacterium]
MRDWPGREHVETLRVWPVLVETVMRIEVHPHLFVGAFLLGSLSRGEGDAISDVDLVAVTERGRWDAAWQSRELLSSGALVRFDRVEGGVGGHSWLTPELIKVECLIAARGGALRLKGDVVVLVGDESLPEDFERTAPLTREAVDAYAADLRARGEISDVEAAYGDLIALLRRELRGPS